GLSPLFPVASRHSPQPTRSVPPPRISSQTSTPPPTRPPPVAPFLLHSARQPWHKIPVRGSPPDGSPKSSHRQCAGGPRVALRLPPPPAAKVTGCPIALRRAPLPPESSIPPRPCRADSCADRIVPAACGRKMSI